MMRFNYIPKPIYFPEKSEIHITEKFIDNFRENVIKENIVIIVDNCLTTQVHSIVNRLSVLISFNIRVDCFNYSNSCKDKILKAFI